MRIEGVLFWVFPHRGECEFREKNILGKSCTTFVIVKIVRNLSRGRSPCQRVNHVKSGVIYFSVFVYSCIRYYSYVEPGPNIKNLKIWKYAPGAEWAFDLSDSDNNSQAF